MNLQNSMSKVFCPVCDSKLNLEFYEHDTLGYCDNCFNFYGNLLNEDMCCNKPSPQVVKKVIKDGRIQLRNQCQNCYSITGTAIKQANYDLNAIKFYDPELEQNFDFQRNFLYTAFRKKIEIVFTEQTKLNASFLDQSFDYEVYENYLKSNVWKEKRKKVLLRDKNTCQSCLKAKAKQVHHISYKHLMNEPLFELVSVCEPCHENISLMDKGQFISTEQTRLFKNLLT